MKMDSLHLSVNFLRSYLCLADDAVFLGSFSRVMIDMHSCGARFSLNSSLLWIRRCVIELSGFRMLYHTSNGGSRYTFWIRGNEYMRDEIEWRMTSSKKHCDNPSSWNRQCSPRKIFPGPEMLGTRSGVSEAGFAFHVSKGSLVGKSISGSSLSR